MSSSLVRKALEVVESDFRNTGNPKKSKDEIKKSMKHKKSTFKQQKRILGDALSEAALQVDKAKKRVRSEKDLTDDNLKKLAILNGVKTVNHKTVTKILEHSVKSRRLLDESAPIEGSLFTEEDFAKFEEEYFVN